MKHLILFFVVFNLTARSALSHGLGRDLYTPDDEREAARDREVFAPGESFTKPRNAKHHRWWSASLATGWTSREMHYGVDETGPYGAYATELSLRLQRLKLSVWSGFGTGNDYQEWDFTIAYTCGTDTLFFIPGYNFRYQPGIVSHKNSELGNHDHGMEEEHEQHQSPEHGNDHDQHSHEDPGHSHGTYGNELFFSLGTKAIPYVTSSLLFLCDLNNTPGSYLQLRVDGDIPLFRRILLLEPYALLGLNLGYNTTAYYGWNHFQFGFRASWQMTRMISVHGGISYSVAMTALREIDQGNEVWANVGLTFSY
jgi:hypothetical protein